MRALAVAERLREDIRAGRFHPRERLVEAELAVAYGVTRSAARAAILELAAEGLVERTPNRGARVRSFSTEEAIEMAEARLLLQAMCARRAAQLGTDEDRVELLRDVEDLRSAIARDSQEETIAANGRIFSRIRSMSGHATAVAIIEQLQSQTLRQSLQVLIPGRRFESLREFERIVEAVVAGEPDEAYDATITHMHNVIAAVRAGVRNSSETD